MTLKTKTNRVKSAFRVRKIRTANPRTARAFQRMHRRLVAMSLGFLVLVAIGATAHVFGNIDRSAVQANELGASIQANELRAFLNQPSYNDACLEAAGARSTFGVYSDQVKAKYPQCKASSAQPVVASTKSVSSGASTGKTAIAKPWVNTDKSSAVGSQSIENSSAGLSDGKINSMTTDVTKKTNELKYYTQALSGRGKSETENNLLKKQAEAPAQELLMLLNEAYPLSARECQPAVSCDALMKAINEANTALAGAKAKGVQVSSKNLPQPGCEGLGLGPINNINIGLPFGSFKIGDCAQQVKPTLDGPGAEAGLSKFASHYKGNTYSSAVGMLAGWTNFVLPFVSLLAIAAIIYAGFLYITALGNDEQVNKAKDIILWVVVGIVVILSAYAIVNTVLGGSAG